MSQLRMDPQHSASKGLHLNEHFQPVHVLYVRGVTRRFREVVARNARRKPTTGLESASVAALPTFAYARPAAADGGASTQCNVCLGAMSEGETARALPSCGHVFHVDCIDAWLRTRSTCPVCRADLKLFDLVNTGEYAKNSPPPPAPPLPV